MNLGKLALTRLNSLTKYPSIPTFHPLGERGRLLDEHLPVPAEPLYATEKINGTNDPQHQRQESGDSKDAAGGDLAAENGRLREALRDLLAKLDPIPIDSPLCTFCGDGRGHAKECLWVRAQTLLRGCR
jgi:hypothetical protein